MTEILPTPNTAEVAKLKTLYYNRFGLTLTDEQAAELLGRLMRYVYLIESWS